MTSGVATEPIAKPKAKPATTLTSASFAIGTARKMRKKMTDKAIVDVVAMVVMALVVITFFITKRD